MKLPTFNQIHLNQPLRFSIKRKDLLTPSKHSITVSNIQNYHFTVTLIIKDKNMKTVNKYNLFDSLKPTENIEITENQQMGPFIRFSKSQHSDQYYAQLPNFKDNQGSLATFQPFRVRQNNSLLVKFSTKKENNYNPEELVGRRFLFVCRSKSAQSKEPLNFCPLGNKITLSLAEILQSLFKTFKGKIYTKKDTEYFIRIEQYASSTFPSSQMQPYLLAYPQDTSDIALMLKIAHLLAKKVVARSGGHQYSGLSLGSSNTIVLSMDQFNTLCLNQDGIIESGPCVPLNKFSEKLNEWGISVPHGQCPLVNIGGHGQTGGYGCFLRSYGLFIDYIQAFDIVLANGELKRVYRPSPHSTISNNEERLNLELFRSVLGGNAGSFGIVTKYFIKGNKNEEHPNSFGFSKARLYSEELLKSLMIIQKQWTQLIAIGQDQKLKGLDFFIKIGQVQLQHLNTQVSVIIITGVYGDVQKGIPYNNQFKQLFDMFQEGQTHLQNEINDFIGSWEGFFPLTQIGCNSVYQVPQLTQSGREIGTPYNRRSNATFTPLSNSFIDQYAGFITNMVNNKEESISFDVMLVVGGGCHRALGKPTIDGLTVTSLPQRDLVHLSLFDLECDLSIDPKATEKAREIQSRMQMIVDQHYSSPGLGEKKFFWGSFGDLDMKKESVIKTFYDNLEDYAQLQQLKRKVDPIDVFHTVMTVKLPQ